MLLVHPEGSDEGEHITSIVRSSQQEVAIRVVLNA